MPRERIFSPKYSCIMANPFERKFKQFAASLDASSTADKVNQTATEAQAVYQDKPFSVEYRPLFAVARIGRTLAQVVTFTATAGIAAFVILQVAPPWSNRLFIGRAHFLAFRFWR